MGRSEDDLRRLAERAKRVHLSDLEFGMDDGVEVLWVTLSTGLRIRLDMENADKLMDYLEGLLEEKEPWRE